MNDSYNNYLNAFINDKERLLAVSLLKSPVVAKVFIWLVRDTQFRLRAGLIKPEDWVRQSRKYIRQQLDLTEKEIQAAIEMLAGNRLIEVKSSDNRWFYHLNVYETEAALNSWHLEWLEKDTGITQDMMTAVNNLRIAEQLKPYDKLDYKELNRLCSEVTKDFILTIRKISVFLPSSWPEEHRQHQAIVLGLVSYYMAAYGHTDPEFWNPSSHSTIFNCLDPKFDTQPDRFELGVSRAWYKALQELVLDPEKSMALRFPANFNTTMPDSMPEAAEYVFDNKLGYADKKILDFLKEARDLKSKNIRPLKSTFSCSDFQVD